jgi:tRNA(adenine34) deaminase
VEPSNSALEWTPAQPRDAELMFRALGQAQRAAQLGEVPIGCIVVRQGVELASAHDSKELLKDPSGHAEVNALRRSAEIIGDWRLDGCDLYVTLEPCPMCLGVILHARIRRLIYGASNRRWSLGESGIQSILQNPSFNHQVLVTRGVCEQECATLLKETFRRYRGERIPHQDS